MLHFEDFTVGQTFPLGPYDVARDEVISFAREFDPQPFHLDEQVAQASILGGLAASGWHNCAMLMRMICDAYLNESASMGSNGLAEVKWLKPVYAGETLNGTMTVLSARVSKSRPELGILECRWDLFNAAGELKLSQIGINFIRVRAPC